MKSIDELAANLSFTTAKTGDDRSVTFLPDPPRAPRRYTLISVDDHIVEPPDTFTGRLPQRFADRAPKVVDTADGGQTWVYDDQVLPNVGFNAVVGRPVSEYGFEPVRFDEMRRGAWDIDERVRDMDLNGDLRLAELSLVPAGFRRPATAAGDQRSRPRVGLGACVERLAPRRVGRFAPRSDHSVPVALAAGP